MRLYALKLSQPTVFALTLSFLLIVMNLEQVRCNEEIKFLYHSVSQNYLTMHPNGSVTTGEGQTSHQCMVLNTVVPPRGKQLKLTIYNPASGMYLCFNKTEILVGKKQVDKNCFFHESFDEMSFIEYRLATGKPRHNQKPRPRYIVFSKNGKPQRTHKKKKQNSQFMKMDPKGKCSEHQNETYVPIRHSKHKRRHKP